jgi:hemerythrin-like domain-containing protein
MQIKPLPDPHQIDDPMRFLRACHGVIEENLITLESVIADAETRGVAVSFTDKPEWHDLFQFFSIAVQRHERDEEEGLFEMLLSKLPHTGFQSPDSPVRFLKEGHEVLGKRLGYLTSVWRNFLDTKDEVDVSEPDFIGAAKELVSLYRDHISFENNGIYKTADNELTPAERERVMDAIRGNHEPDVETPVPDFSPPTFSGQIGEVQFVLKADRPEAGDEE